MRFFKTPVSILVLAFAGLIVLTGLGHYATASGITPPNIIQGRDAVGAAPTVPPIVQAGFDGTDLQYMKVTSAANLTATPTIGALLSEKATRFALFNGASTGSQSTASIAAAAGVYHVCDCISYSAAAGTAPTATIVDVVLRDGATGAGTIKWAYVVDLLATTGEVAPPQTVCGLNIIGSVNTAMTFEFTAGVTNVTEVVNFTYFNVQ